MKMLLEGAADGTQHIPDRHNIMVAVNHILEWEKEGRLRWEKTAGRVSEEQPQITPRLCCFRPHQFLGNLLGHTSK